MAQADWPVQAASTSLYPESWGGIVHIIVIAVGTSGDVHPLLGLSRTFAKLGHRVSFCTSPAFAQVVERCGLRFLPFGTTDQYYPAIHNPPLRNPRTPLQTLCMAV